ncbi:pilus assembly protein FlpE [Oryzobacter telluris]|uniref:nucleotide-binding protein n=1 Tax=Oryzobacter telluris TaxID=3149179 RepID=UPI00370D30A2
MTQPTLLAVSGASGGLGASTLALALGRCLARAGPPVVVADLDLAGGGLEVTAGVEHLPGRRWDDLREVRGRVPAARLLATLPGEAGCHVLSGLGGARPEVAPEVVLEVVDSLLAGGVSVVLDLPVRGPLLADVMARAPVLVVVTALRTRGLADAEACVERALAVAPESRADPVLLLVTRGGRATTDVLDDVVAHLGVPHVHHVRDDPAVARGGERGAFPGVSRDAVRACAEAVVAALPGIAVAS